jgi:YHS domain-containing protein
MRNHVYASALALIAILVLAPGASALGKNPAVVAPQQAQEAIIPIEGLDPVLLSQGKEAQGDMKIFVIRGRFQYLFASEETRAAFEKDPSRYEIQYGGLARGWGLPTAGTRTSTRSTRAASTYSAPTIA